MKNIKYIAIILLLMMPLLLVADEQEPDPNAYMVLDNDVSPNLEKVRKFLYYPDKAIEAGAEGKVVIKILVNKKGLIKKHIIVESSSELLEEAAYEAISNAQPYTIALQGADSVMYWTTIPLEFDLSALETYRKESDGLHDDAYRVFDNDVTPDFSHVYKYLTYPKDAIDSHLEGKVVVRVLMDKQGFISKHEILQSDYEIFEMPCINALEEGQPYTIAIYKGKPVFYWASVPFRFKLNAENVFDFTNGEYKKFNIDKPKYNDLIESVDYGDLNNDINFLGCTEVQIKVNKEGKLIKREVINKLDDNVNELILSYIDDYKFEPFIYKDYPREITTTIVFPFRR